jgi:hypothetical protein
MSLVRIICLWLFPALMIAQAPSKPSAPHVAKTAADPAPPAAVRDAADRILGSTATILRFGHLSSADQTEAVVAIPIPTTPKSGDALTVSRLAILREHGSDWKPDLSVDRVIRNSQGFLGATSLDQVHPSDTYKVVLSNRAFEDGKERFVIQLTPVDAEGETTAPSVYVSWNPLVGRYQQISLQGYGFEPEIHEPLPAKAQ